MTALHLTESIGRSPLRHDLFLITLVLACFAPARTVFAVSPAPDGGYPGNNTAEGTSALFSLTSGISNTAVGFQSLYKNTTGNYNTANGINALRDSRGAQNTATGSGALGYNLVGNYNTANGYNALPGFGNGSNDAAIGLGALFSNRTGTENTAVGVSALANNTRGIQNTAVGFKALILDTRGPHNIGLGYEAGIAVCGFFNHIEIGNGGGCDNYTTRIGDVQTRTFIAGIGGTAVVGDTVVVNANGQLGTATSSARFKKEIKPMDKASEAILALKPVSFQYQNDPKETPQFGLIAEEVAKVNPDLVTRDRNGEIYSVRYEAVNTMLLNEFLKQHKALLEERRKVREQQATITLVKSTVAQQQKDFQAAVEQLTKRAHEQASQIQKVSAQLAAASLSRAGLEVIRQAPQVAENNR
jgi:hypothetical protein